MTILDQLSIADLVALKREAADKMAWCGMIRDEKMKNVWIIRYQQVEKVLQYKIELIKFIPIDTD